MTDEGGFTLVELMVVVLVLAVLLGIGIPTFLGLRNGGYDTAAKESAAVGLRTARGGFESSYDDVTLAYMNASEPALAFVDGISPSTDPSVVSTDFVNPQIMVLASYCRSESCFFIRDDLDEPTQYGTLSPAPAGGCRADNAFLVTFGSSW